MIREQSCKTMFDRNATNSTKHDCAQAACAVAQSDHTTKLVFIGVLVLLGRVFGLDRKGRLLLAFSLAQPGRTVILVRGRGRGIASIAYSRRRGAVGNARQGCRPQRSHRR